MNTKNKTEAPYAPFLCLSIKRKERYAIQLWLDRALYSRNIQYRKRIEYSHFHSGSVDISVLERNLLVLPCGCWMTTEEENTMKLKKVQAVKQIIHTHQVTPFKHTWSVSKYLNWFIALLWGAPLEEVWDDEAIAFQKDMRKSVKKTLLPLDFSTLFQSSVKLHSR